MGERFIQTIGLSCALAACGLGNSTESNIDGGTDGNDFVASAESAIVFVTQVPVASSFTTIGATFGNHITDPRKVPRGGDLWIRYEDGTTKNLTAEAGFGNDGFQGANSIAVREPQPHWDGKKVVFSMVVGTSEQQYQRTENYWQLYEATNLGKDETPVITKVPNQPENYNNVSPTYATDDQIIFVTDRPRSGERHLYPQLDEYEGTPIVSGLWKLNSDNGDLQLLTHTPSGAFGPRVDSFGRVVFIRWDHLQRDLMSDGHGGPSDAFGTFDYANESAGAAKLAERVEVFPEPRPSRTDLLAGTNMNPHTFNLFFPWMINEDGTEEETLNHIGRHELRGYAGSSIKDDSNVREFIAATSGRTNQNTINNFFQIVEDPAVPGRYFGIDAVEFETNSAGQIIALELPPGEAPDSVQLEYITHRDSRSVSDSEIDPGKYRNPVPMRDGSLVASYSPASGPDDNEGTRTNPDIRYAFRLRTVTPNGTYLKADEFLTSGIEKTVSYWDPDQEVTYSGELWEWDAIELVNRPRPQPVTPELPTPEADVFDSLSIDPTDFANYMKSKNLALIVSRDVTVRDKLDTQQPFNLRVPGGVQSTTGTGKVYDITHLQLLQADQLRGKGGIDSPADGRRVLPRFMHDSAAVSENGNSGVEGAVALGADGSMAAFVPARRAMTWQLTDDGGDPVVRERYWVTFQPGEIRVCASCHGLSSEDQLGRSEPENSPDALYDLLSQWKMRNP